MLVKCFNCDLLANLEMIDNNLDSEEGRKEPSMNYIMTSRNEDQIVIKGVKYNK